MATYRKEHDLLGERDVPADALYGVHTLRAVENFPLTGRGVPNVLIRAFGAVKLACVRTNFDLGMWDDATFDALSMACEEMIEGKLDEHILVDALQGGAGTSTNMNVNEVIANRALVILGRRPGEYDVVSPLDDVNRHQSTNDTYPTSLKVAAIWRLRELEREVIALLEAFQANERRMSHIVKIGRTQMQDAVLTTLGREMSAYAEAFARDRWRIYKCEERLRVVNLGGTAIGTGIGAPRRFIFSAIEHLREITGLGLARAENLVEATQNHDVFVEVSGILKAHASNLMKVASDLRWLSSGPKSGLGEIRLPPRQSGSSIMPGKVNPVVPEAVTQVALAMVGYDQAITMACSMGNLELNPFLPLVADSLLNGLTQLRNVCTVFRRFCVENIEANEAQCRLHVDNGTAAVTALVEALGYAQAERIAEQAAADDRTVRQIVIEEGLMSAEQFDAALSPERVAQLGSRKEPAATKD